MYSAIDKNFKIALYASYQFGDKVTEKQLDMSTMAITHSTDSRTLRKYREDVLRDYSPLAKPQFRKEGDHYIPTPNRPKTPNEMLAEAYTEKQKRDESENVSS